VTNAPARANTACCDGATSGIAPNASATTSQIARTAATLARP